MDDFFRRAGYAVGAILGAVIAFFLVKFLLFAEGLLAVLLIIVAIVAATAACVALIGWARRSWKSPRIVFDSQEKQASLVIEQDGSWTALPKQPFPALSSFSYHEAAPPKTVQALPAAFSPQEILPALPIPLPNARTLVLQGAVGYGDEILLGFDENGQEIRRTWKQLKGMLILGLQGGGKTTTACWLLLQVVISGGKIALVDKHARSQEDSMTAKLSSLRKCFACEVGGDPVTALAAIKHVRSIFDERLEGAPCDYPLLLVVDEYTAIVRQTRTKEPWSEVSSALLSLLKDLNTEGRKHRVYALCIGQVANASRSGGSDVRDTFNTRIIHAMREKQAQILSLTDYKQEIARLEVGQVYVDMEGAGAPFFVQIPYVSEDDLQFIKQNLGRFPTVPALPPLPYKDGRKEVR